MRSLSLAVTLGLLLGAVWAHVLPTVSRPPCDSPEVEAAALVAQDYLNAQHTHGYKYVLNRIEDVKIISSPSGEDTYFVEVELLQTKCHVLDPTDIANCTVRPKVMTAVEGDCDVVLKEVGGALSVTGFKCKTEESREDICVGCPTLLPLNDTSGLDLVHASLGTFNGRTNDTFTLMQVGRMSKQVVSGGFTFAAEYVIIKATCNGTDCVPLESGDRGFCVAQGLVSGHTIDCSMLAALSTVVPEGNSTAVLRPALLPVIHAITGLAHHKLTLIHNPELSGLLSAESHESAESGEVLQVMANVPVTTQTNASAPPSIVLPTLEAPVPDKPTVSPGLPAEDQGGDLADVMPTDVMPTPEAVPSVDLPDVEEDTKAGVVKRAAELVEAVIPAPSELPLLLVPMCPGRIRHY